MKKHLLLILAVFVAAAVSAAPLRQPNPIRQHGKEEGMNKAKRYLEIPLSHLKEADRVSEIAFRDELRQSMSTHQ